MEVASPTLVQKSVNNFQNRNFFKNQRENIHPNNLTEMDVVAQNVQLVTIRQAGIIHRVIHLLHNAFSADSHTRCHGELGKLATSRPSLTLPPGHRRACQVFNHAGVNITWQEQIGQTMRRAKTSTPLCVTSRGLSYQTEAYPWTWFSVHARRY